MRKFVDKKALIDDLKRQDRPHGVSWRDYMAVLDQIEEVINAMPTYQLTEDEEQDG